MLVQDLNAKEETRKAQEKLHEAQRRTLKVMAKIEEENKEIIEEREIIKGEKMNMELQFADMVDKHKIQVDALRVNMKKIRRYTAEKETYLKYAHGVIVILVTIIIAIFGLLIGLL